MLAPVYALAPIPGQLLRLSISEEGATAMSAENLVEKHVRAFNDHDAEAWAGAYAEKATLHDPQYPAPLAGRDAIRKDIDDFFVAFPDMQFRVLSVASSGDLVAVEGV